MHFFPNMTFYIDALSQKQQSWILLTGNHEKHAYQKLKCEAEGHCLPMYKIWVSMSVAAGAGLQKASAHHWGMSQHELLVQSILPMANLRDSLIANGVFVATFP